MDTIVKIEYNNRTTIHESVNISEYKTHYLSFWSGNSWDFDVVSKTNDKLTRYGAMMEKPFVKGSTWQNVLFVSGKKYHANPEFWTRLCENFREKNDVRKWLKTKKY